MKSEFHYGGLRDEADRKGFITVSSDKNRSYKDFYKDLLEAERDIGKVHESNRNNSDLSKSRKKLKNSLGEVTEVTNKDIKDEIRKLAKKEKLERVAKKAALIGVPVAAAAIGTSVAIKKHKKKKEQE